MRDDLLNCDFEAVNEKINFCCLRNFLGKKSEKMEMRKKDRMEKSVK